MSADGVFLQPGIDALTAIHAFNSGFVKKFASIMDGRLYNSIGVLLAASGWLSPKYCAVGMVFQISCGLQFDFGMKVKKD